MKQNSKYRRKVQSRGILNKKEFFFSTSFMFYSLCMAFFLEKWIFSTLYGARNHQRNNFFQFILLFLDIWQRYIECPNHYSTQNAKIIIFTFDKKKQFPFGQENSIIFFSLMNLTKFVKKNNEVHKPAAWTNYFMQLV